jgi:predicted Rossmann fold flavoprotein
MDVSRWFEVLPPGERPDLFVDFLPDWDVETKRRRLLAAIEALPARAIARVLPGCLPRRLAEGLCLAAGVPPDLRAGEINRVRRHSLVLTLVRWAPPVAGTRGFDYAEVTAGGVALPEVDPGTMESRIVSGLFLAGEILDVDGPIGGFNFQSAFSTAHSAGLHL